MMRKRVDRYRNWERPHLREAKNTRRQNLPRRFREFLLKDFPNPTPDSERRFSSRKKIKNCSRMRVFLLTVGIQRRKRFTRTGGLKGRSKCFRRKDSCMKRTGRSG